MERIKIFISSVMDELEYEREVACRVIKDLNLEPSMFEIFPSISKKPNKAYIDEVRNCDIFMIIMWRKLSKPVKEEYLEAVRMNKPILMFVKALKGTEKRDQNLDIFLGKIENRKFGETGYEVYPSVYDTYRSLADFKDALKNAVINEISKFYQSPQATSTREEMYELGTDIIKFAQKRLYVTQRTPSLFFGPREYNAPDSERIHYEKEFYDALGKWIDSTIDDIKREGMYLYPASVTKTEMEEYGLESRTEKAITYYKEKEKESRYRFRISSVVGEYSGPVIVGDNRFAIWIAGENKALCISQTNEKVADAIIRIFKQVGSKRKTVDELLEELHLKKQS